MTAYPKYPTELARKNQTLLAGRLRWPVGALAACWDLENRFPGWRVSWLGENTHKGFERPAGFWATWDVDGHHAELFRRDAGELAERLAEGVPEHVYGREICPWCMRHAGWRRVRL